ncbi:MAG: hypothetical protein J7621_25995 [Niastella sp.]|nr:hypothetical protein [Niastella sp.]
MKVLLLLISLSIACPCCINAQTTIKPTLQKKITPPAKRPVYVSLEKQAKDNIVTCWLQYQSRLGLEHGTIKKEGDIFYQVYEKGWVITNGEYTFPVTGFILQQFLKTGGIATNGVPLEVETNKRLENSNLNYQAFSKSCFWGCGTTILRIDQPFFDQLKIERPLENTLGYKCASGPSPIAGSFGKVLFFQKHIMAYVPGSPVIDLAVTDKLYLKWKETDFLGARLGCPTALEVQYASNSTKVIARVLRFERGSIAQINMNIPGANEIISVNYK